MLNSLKKMKEDVNYKKDLAALTLDSVGKCIDGEQTRRQITIMTPGYLQ